MRRYLAQFLVPTNLIQIGIGLLVFYYCFETHKVRVNSEAQLKALRDQVNYQTNPVISISFRREIGSDDKSSRHIKTGDTIYEWNPYIKVHGEHAIRQVATVHFDKGSESFVWSDAFLDVIAGKDEQRLSLAGKPISVDDLIDEMKESYGPTTGALDKSLKERAESFVLVVYRNSLGQPSYLKQRYRFKDDQFVRLLPESGPL